MALTEQDLQAIEALLDKKVPEELQPIHARLDVMTTHLDAVFKKLSDLDDERLAGREQLRRLEEFCEKKCA